MNHTGSKPVSRRCSLPKLLVKPLLPTMGKGILCFSEGGFGHGGTDPGNA